MLIYAPTRTIVAPWVSQALAERAAGSAIAPIPLQQIGVVSIGRAAGECIHARMFHFRCSYQPGDCCLDLPSLTLSGRRRWKR